MSETKSAGGQDSAIITLIAETHIHASVGQSTGALDLPVARERTTHYPFIPGSGVKGAFRVWAEERAKLDKKVNELFGQEGSSDDGGDGNAGNLLCADVRLLLLPVRCLSDAYKWITCPALLNRFNRDTARAKNPANLSETGPADGKYLGAGEANAWLGLEEREFQKVGGTDNNLITALAKIAGVDDKVMTNRLVILSDKDFTWFARYALPVMARNALDENKKVKPGALWYEESLAPDTVMYVLFGQRKDGAVSKLTQAIGTAPYVQMGGNETIGQGWFKMTGYPFPENGGADG